MTQNASPEKTTLPASGAHGARRLTSVNVDSYNVELKDEDGFIGDRASKGAFRAIVEKLRKALRKTGTDPIGEESSNDLKMSDFDAILARGEAEAIGVLQGATEEFSQALAGVIREYLKLKDWKDTQRIAIGGGFRSSRVGELVIGRTSVILKADNVPIEIVPIHNDPDEAGLIGAVHLAPSWMFEAFDGILGVDIGGTNIRAGIVRLNLKKVADLSKANVWKFALWRHGDEEDVKREQAITTLGDMLQGLIASTKKKRMRLAPFIAIGCPGFIQEDGSIDRGAQNLPGNWESSRFNLPLALHALVPEIEGHETAIVMHNDAVVQGLSEIPHMTDVQHWGILTIGTGLGNARFTKRGQDDA